MRWVQLPKTAGCVVCGPDNPHGLRLTFEVDLDLPADQAVVRTALLANRHHIGFHGILHGGMLATVLDEVMVWSALWASRRFCYCGELSIRYRLPVRVGMELTAGSRVLSFRRRLIETQGRIVDAAGQVYVEATAKYMPVPDDQHRQMVEAFMVTPESAEAHRRLVHPAD